jgi:hypothetical protein
MLSSGGYGKKMVAGRWGKRLGTKSTSTLALELASPLRGVCTHSEAGWARRSIEIIERI